MQLLGFSILCLIWGTTWLAIKFSLGGFPPFLGAAARFTIAALTVGIMLVARKKSFRLTRHSLKVLILASFLMYVFDYGMIYWGEMTLSAGITAIFFSSFAMFTALWSILILKTERLTPRRWGGLILGLLGIVVIFFDQLLITQFSQKVVLSILAIMLGAAGGALSNVLVKKHLEKTDAGVITFYQMAFGIVFLYIIGFLAEDAGSIHITPKVAYATLYLALVGSAFAFVLYYRLLKTMDTITLSLIIYVTPIIAIVADYIAFGELIPLRSLLGMVLIFSGIALVQQRSRTLPDPVIDHS